MSLRSLPEISAFQRPEGLVFEPPEQTLEAFDPSIEAAAGDGTAEISIYGQIGLDPVAAVDNTERRIAAALRAIGPKEVTVNINSPGGNFFNGLAIYNLLRAHPAKVSVNVIAMAGSAASVIAMAGDTIMMADGAFMLVHNASGVVVGNKFDMQEVAEVLTEVDAAMAKIYAARADVDLAVAAGWMDRHRGDGTMFAAAAAIESGLADGRLAQGAVKVRAEASRTVPRERVIERALVAAANMSPQEAKALIAEIKAGTRDAPVNVKRDADDLTAALAQLRNTLRS